MNEGMCVMELFVCSIVCVQFVVGCLHVLETLAGEMCIAGSRNLYVCVARMHETRNIESHLISSHCLASHWNDSMI